MNENRDVIPAAREHCKAGAQPRGLLASRTMLSDLSAKDRLRLMKFVCSFAWADLEIQPEERAFIARMMRGLRLEASEELQVHKWLDVPPELDGLDPTAIPKQHRRFFLDAIEGVVASDGRVTSEERDSLEVFSALLREP